MARVETGLGLIDIFQPKIDGNFELTEIRIRQPSLSIVFEKDLNFRGLLINPANQTVWIMYGPPDNEPNLQTLSYWDPTEIRLVYENISGRCYTLKINL